MQETDNKNSAENVQKGSPVVLLLFVGFIFGLIVGFATKDQVVRQYSKMITKVVKDTDIPAGPIVAVEETVVIEKAGEAKPDEAKDEKKDEEKKKEEEEKKKEEAKKAEETKPEEKKEEEKKAE